MEFFSVGVKNVQSIESLEFDFPVRESGGSFVTFVGPSSSGKSALLRAIHALVNNTSSAAVLLRSDAKHFEVSATTKAGYVAITRGASLSTYQLGTEKYTKAGTSVPEDVATHLGFKDPDLHLRFQFDRPYLLDVTSGQAATALSRLSHAHILRDAASKATKTARKGDSDLTVLGSEKDAAQQALESLGDVEAQGQRVEEIQEALQGIQNTISRAAQVQSALGLIQSRTALLSAAQDVLSKVPDLSHEFATLREGVDWHTEVARDVQRCYSALQQIEAAPTTDTGRVLAAMVQETEEKISHHAAVQQALMRIAQTGVETAQAAHSTALGDIRTIEEQIAQVRSSLEICPACGQEVVGA